MKPILPGAKGGTAITASAFGALDCWIAFGIGVLTLALYWPAHGFDFVHFDDLEYVRENLQVRAGLTWDGIRWAWTTTMGSFYTPLLWLSLQLDAQLYGPGPTGHHVTNVLLHAANAVVLFALLRAATAQRWPSALVAAVFALHPQHVESVAWIIERKDVLSTLLLFATLWCYGAYAARPTLARYLLTFVVYVAGLMAKPMLTTLPVLLLFVDLWPLRRFSRWPPPRLLLEKVPFLVPSAASSLVTLVSGQHLDVSAPLAGVAIGERLAFAAQSTVLYLMQMLWPVGFCVLYPEQPAPPWWQTGIAVLGLAAVTAAAFRAVATRPYLLAGWLWYLVALVPVSGIVKIGNFTMADRFTYVPLLGVYAAIAFGLRELVTTQARRATAAVAAALVLAGSALGTAMQLPHWRNTITLFERAIAVTGPNPVAHYLLGLGLADRGDSDAAIAHYAEALRLRPGYAHVHTSLGVLLADQGRVEEAIAQYEAALRAEPTEAYAHANLGTALLRRGRVAEAMTHLAEAIRLDPNVASFRNNYGRALADQGRLDEAIAEYTTALTLAPHNAEAHNNLANAMAARGRPDDALAHYTTAVRLRPDYAAAHVNLARFFVQHERFPEAVEHYQAALRMTPDDVPIRSDLGNALAAQGKLEEAVAAYTEALRQQPQQATVHNNLGNVLLMLGRVDEGLAHYRQALAADPNAADAHYNLGVVLAERGQSDAAIEHFAAALRARPDYGAARARLEQLQAARPSPGRR